MNEHYYNVKIKHNISLKKIIVHVIICPFLSCAILPLHFNKTVLNYYCILLNIINITQYT